MQNSDSILFAQFEFKECGNNGFLCIFFDQFVFFVDLGDSLRLRDDPTLKSWLA